MPPDLSDIRSQIKDRFAALNRIVMEFIWKGIVVARYAALATLKPHPLPWSNSFKRTSRWA